MKRLLQLCFALLLAGIMMVSCNKGGPKDVATKWLTSFNQMDYETAKKYSTDDTKKFLSELDELYKILPDSSKKEMKNVTVTVKDVKEDGDKAVATFTTSLDPGKDQQLSLVKQGGKWLVQFSKDDASEEMNPDDAEPADTTGAAPVQSDAPGGDSVKH
jgi:hypothetical protein